ncbi:hypothetical protein [Devosia sp. MC521]|uniref:hypothetical protein n=1 Tax=Devosia sp. MC521 TaxID=2759954 RepID=UPI0015FD8008|nr:hypothetical protein [Devosia sp. MC521]MBJ6986930.1 hypothetical protein [Devosia sp. MC521]QMW63954.1 hypothetical protein H4N61_06460 [Devosia sp. MC521]
MEAGFFFILGGIALGVALGVLWAGVDMLLGMQTLSEHRFVGLVFVSSIITPIALAAVALWSEFRG